MAATLLGLLMQLVVSTLSVLSYSKAGLMARSEPRQQLRSFVTQLQSDLREAAYIYPEGSYQILGSTFDVPGAGVPGTGILFAVPETSVSPVTYRVCYAFSRPRSKLDRRNEESYEAVYYYVEGVDPPVSDLPSEINPNNLPGGSLKVFDSYFDGPEGFVTHLTPTGFGVSLDVHYKLTPDKGDTTEQKLNTTIVLRNGL